MRASVVLRLALVLALTACGGAPRPEGRARPDLLTSAELREENTGALTLDQLIARLRPLWLRERVSSITQGRVLPVVYLNGTRYGEIAVLRSIPVNDVEEVHYLSASDATTLYGTGHAGGVIAVEIRR